MEIVLGTLALVSFGLLISFPELRRWIGTSVLALLVVSGIVAKKLTGVERREPRAMGPKARRTER